MSLTLPRDAETAGEAPAVISAAIGESVVHGRMFDGEHPFQLVAVKVTIETEIIFLITIAATGGHPTVITNRVDAVIQLAGQVGVTKDQLPIRVEIINRLEFKAVKVGLGALPFGSASVEIQRPRTLGELSAKGESLMIIPAEGLREARRVLGIIAKI